MSCFLHLTKRSEFLRVQNRGSKTVSKAFVLQGCQRADSADDIASWRVGFTASKRVGNAVRRNRAKRRLRALVRQEMPDLARPEIDYVLIARVPATDASYRLDPKALRIAIKELHKKLDRRSAASGSNTNKPSASDPDISGSNANLSHASSAHAHVAKAHVAKAHVAKASGTTASESNSKDLKGLTALKSEQPHAEPDTKTIDEERASKTLENTDLETHAGPVRTAKGAK